MEVRKLKITPRSPTQSIHLLTTVVRMQPEEAVASAISEFESQGVDLSNIITTANGGNLSGHPAADAAAQLEAALGEGDLVDAVQAIVALQTALCGGDLGENSAAVAMSVNAVPLTLRCLSAAIGAANPSAQKASLQALAAFLSLSAAVRASFREGHGPRSVAQLLEAATASDNTTNPEIAAATLAVAAASARGDEDGKCALMDLGVGVLALRTLGSSWAADMQEAVLAACATLSALTTADDTSQPSSRYYMESSRALRNSSCHLNESFLTGCHYGGLFLNLLCSMIAGRSQMRGVSPRTAPPRCWWRLCGPAPALGVKPPQPCAQRCV